MGERPNPNKCQTDNPIEALLIAEPYEETDE